MNLLYDKLTALGFEVERPAAPSTSSPRPWERTCAFCPREPREFDLLLVPSDGLASRAMCALPTVNTEKVSAACRLWKKLAAAFYK